MMPRIRNTALTGAALLATIAPASAETLREAMVKAYATNPTLAAQRDNVKAIDEGVPLARSGAFPTVQLQSQHTENIKNPSIAFLAPDRQFGANVALTLPIYQGGRVSNAIAAADKRVDAGRASLRGTEADLFTNVVAAYMDVTRDEAIVGFNQQNLKVLDINLRAARDRFQVGDLTRTDVAQSEARLELARSQLQTAQGRLISSRETYVRLVGSPPGVLVTPPPLPQLPATPDAAVDIALHDNPVLLAAKKTTEAASYDVKVARGNRLPTLNGFVNGGYQNFLGTLAAPTQVLTNAQAGLQLSVPLFQGGLPAAQIRQSQARRVQSLEQLTETERGVVAQSRSAYAVWQSSLQVIESARAALEANKFSLEGVKAENSVGNRTIIEILNAEQEYINSQVTLVTAQRDAYVAGFALLAAMGHAEAKDLGLDSGNLYDPTVNYRRVRNNIWDWAGEHSAGPVSTSTATTPAQNATVVSPTLDIPALPVDSRAPNDAGIGRKRN